MHQSYLLSRSPFEEKKNQSGIFCELCLRTQSEQTNLCTNCFILLCSNCKNQHMCLRSSGYIVKAPIETMACQNNQHSDNYSRFKDKDCERCSRKLATINCFDCSINQFCLSCFQELHRTPKMRRHKALQSVPHSFRPLDIICVSQGDLINGLWGFQAQVATNRKSQRQSYDPGDGEDYQIEKAVLQLICQREKVEEKARSALVRANQQRIAILSELELIVQQVKLKIVELDLKFEAQKKRIQSASRQLLKGIQQNLLICKQINLFDRNCPNFNHIREKRLSALITSIINILSGQEALKSSIEGQISNSFFTQATRIKQQITKLSPVKSIQILSAPQIKQIVASSPNTKLPLKKNRKTLKSAPNSLKDSGICSMRELEPSKSEMASKKDLTGSILNANPSIISCKSMGVINYLEQKSSSKVQKNNQRFILSSSGSTHSHRDLQASLAQRSKLPGDCNPEKKGLQKGGEDVKKKGKLLKGSFGVKYPYVRHNMQFANSGVGKALANIQNTKEQIKQIRLEMSEYSKAGNEGCLAERRKEDSFELQEDLNVSHISIESLVYKGGRK